MKRICILAVLTLGLALTGCTPTLDGEYEKAQRYLGMGEYHMALATFEALGEHKHSSRYALYVKALIALDEGEYVLASQDFANLNGFKSSSMYGDYADACYLEQQGELYDAAALFASLGSFLDSFEREKAINAAIPEQQYKAAKMLYDIGEYEKASDAFTALDDYRDSVVMAKQAQEAMGEKQLLAIEEMLADKQFEQGFEALEGFMKTASVTLRNKAMAIKEKFAAKTDDKVLNASANTDGYTYVSFGTYEGEKLKCIVVNTEENIWTLLTESIVDIVPINQAGEIDVGYDASSLRTFLNTTFKQSFSQTHKAAIKEITLPDMALAKALPTEMRMAQLSKVAQAKNPLASSLNNGVWWLYDTGTLANSHAIVYYNGVIYDRGLPNTDQRTGIRPVITIDTSLVPFEKGQGTKEDPYE